MSSDYELENPYWEKVDDAEEKLFCESAEPKNTDYGTIGILRRTEERVDLALFFLDRLDLNHYRFQSGRLNRRKLADSLIELISERNQTRRKQGMSEIYEVGLRAMELTLKELFSK